MLTVSLLFMMQDLFTRSSDPQSRETVRERDRIEFHLPPALDFPQSGSRRVPIGFEGRFNPNFSCNQFEFGAAFRNLFDKNVREEFLKNALSAVEGEVATNALYLACQASPTLCDLIKHYRLATNMMLQMEYGQCQTLEQVLDGVEHRVAADSMTRCLAEQQRQGKTLPEAMAFCKRSELMSNLSGQRVRDVDLLKELGDVLHLDGGLRDVLSKAVQPLQVNNGSAKTQLQVSGLEPLFAEKREQYETAWRQALEEAAAGEVKPETLRKLVPEGVSPVSGAEVSRLALLPEERRNSVIASLSTASSLSQLSQQLHQIERALEAADHLPTSDPWKPEMERRRKWVRNELKRLEEAYRYQDNLNRSRRAANGVVENDIARAARQIEAKRVYLKSAPKAKEETRRWGGVDSLDGKNTPIETPKEGADCDGCDTQNFSWGQTVRE